MGQGDFGYGVVLLVAVVGSDEVHRGGEVAVAVGVDVGDGDAALLFGGVVVAGFAVANPAAEVSFVGECGLGTEGVEVEVKGNGCEGLASEIFVGEGLGGVERFFVGVEAGVDGVGDDAGGEGLAIGGVGGDAGLGTGLGLRGRGGEKDGGDGVEEASAQHRGIVGACGLDAGSFWCGQVCQSLGCEEASQVMLVGDSGEAGLREGCGVVGEAGCAETGEDAEGEVEAADEELCRDTHGAGGDAEVGDEPEGSGGEGGSDASDERVEFGLGEAVEEEVGDDEVVLLFEREGDGVGVMGAEASGGVGSCCFAALAEELKHCGAGVDCVGAKVRVLLEELGEEASVAVA